MQNRVGRKQCKIMKSIYLRNKENRMAAKGKAHIGGFEVEKRRHVIGLVGKES